MKLLLRLHFQACLLRCTLADSPEAKLQASTVLLKHSCGVFGRAPVSEAAYPTPVCTASLQTFMNNPG